MLYDMSHQNIVMNQESVALSINLFKEIMIKMKMM